MPPHAQCKKSELPAHVSEPACQFEREAHLVGVWRYAKSPRGTHSECYTLNRHNGCLEFVEDEWKGELQGASDGSFQGELYTRDGKHYGTIRVKWVHERQGAVSNFRPSGVTSWGPEIVAVDEAKSVLGNWTYTHADRRECYSILAGSGRLRFVEESWRGDLHAQSGGWFQGQLYTRKNGSLWGTIRLRRVPGGVLSNCMRNGFTSWGADTVATPKELPTVQDSATANKALGYSTAPSASPPQRPPTPAFCGMFVEDVAECSPISFRKVSQDGVEIIEQLHAGMELDTAWFSKKSAPKLLFSRADDVVADVSDEEMLT